MTSRLNYPSHLWDMSAESFEYKAVVYNLSHTDNSDFTHNLQPAIHSHLSTYSSCSLLIWALLPGIRLRQSSCPTPSGVGLLTGCLNKIQLQYTKTGPQVTARPGSSVSVNCSGPGLTITAPLVPAVQYIRHNTQYTSCPFTFQQFPVLAGFLDEAGAMRGCGNLEL